jgi:hypothetical protein
MVKATAIPDTSTNNDRAMRIANALSFYKSEQLAEDGPVDEDTYTDFLTDLRHHCDKEGVDLYALLDRSYNHYLEEKKIDQDEMGDQHAQ